ncbi:MAG: metallophosphoesterase family protein [Turicibacter sp.]
MKFLHLTDIHFLINYPQEKSGYHSLFNTMTFPIEQLTKGLKKVNDFDAVLITGDLTESGTKADYAQLKSDLVRLLGDTPIVVALGNHDNKLAFYEGFLEQLPSNEPYNTCVTLGNTAIISLDNSNPGYPNGIIDTTQCIWLEKTLAKIESEQIILMFHHHIIKDQFTIDAALYDDSFYQLVANSRIDAILCGHTHHAYAGTFAGKPYFTADNLSFSGEDEPTGIVRFEERSGFNYCVLENNKIEVTTIPIETDGKILAYVTFN